MSETSTVVEVVDYENQYAVLSHPHYIKKFRVWKPRNRFHLFMISMEPESPLPKELQGSFSSLQAGINYLTKYLDNSKETQSAKNERLDKERKQRAAKLQSTNS